MAKEHFETSEHILTTQRNRGKTFLRAIGNANYIFKTFISNKICIKNIYGFPFNLKRRLNYH